jgi:hypothetical protein
VEPLSSSQAHRGGIVGRSALRTIFVAGALGLICIGAIVACGKVLKSYSLKDSLAPQTPTLDLKVVYYNVSGEQLDGSGRVVPPTPTQPESSRSNGVLTETPTPTAATPAAQPSVEPTITPTPMPTPTTVACPAIVGGDLLRSMPPQRANHYYDATPVPCPLKATWNVYRHPIGVSLFVKDGAKLLDWYEKNPDFNKLRESSVWKGLLDQMRVILKVRAEDLQLDDWKGEFLQPLFREAVSADAALHYDVAHGYGGVVLTFDRSKAPLLGRALPVLIRTLGASAYDIPSQADPIVEIRLQGSKLFVTQVADRVYIGSSVEGLLNVLAAGTLIPPDGAGSVVGVIRAEAFFEKLLTTMVAAEAWPVSFSLDLSATTTSLAEAVVPQAKFFQVLDLQPMLGVVAAVPHDALASMVVSAKVPLDKPVAEWSFDVASKSTSSGLSLVWDVQVGGKVQVGIAISAPVGATTTEKDGAQKEGALTASDFLSSGAVSSTCAGGAVWLGASSDGLLSRMREACNKQSLSILDIKGIDPAAISGQQVALLFNSNLALRELYKLGGGEVLPKEKSTPLSEALKRLQGEVVTLAKSLPVVGLSGGTAPNQSGIRMKGFSATLGGV